MENKVNYTQAINFINLFHTWRDKGNSKNNNRAALLSDVICWLNFIYIEPNCETRPYFRSFLNHSYINRFIKRNIESKVVSPPQIYIHD